MEKVEEDETKRRTRNLSEKKRRDQFNTFINELALILSIPNKKMDKSSILKATIAYFKHYNASKIQSSDIDESWKPKFLSNRELNFLFMEALNSFVIVFTQSGCIYYVSESVTSLLAYNPNYLLNKNLLDLTLETDRINLYRVMNSPEYLVENEKANEREVSFQCHIQNGNLDLSSDASTHKLVHFEGYSRMIKFPKKDTSSEQQCEQETLSRRFFFCIGQVCLPPSIGSVYLVGSAQSQFTSKHSLEWKFSFLDHHASAIIGYSPFEVIGTSVYDYYHFDDLDKVVSCHEKLMEKGESNTCFYRFLTKGRQWIWIQTHFYIIYHHWDSKPQFVNCYHKVLNTDDTAEAYEKDLAQQESDSDTITTFCNKDVPGSASLQDEPIAEDNNSANNPKDNLFSSFYELNNEVDNDVLGEDDASLSTDAKSSLCLSHEQENSEQKENQLRQIIINQQKELSKIKHELLLAKLGILDPDLDASSSAQALIDWEPQESSLETMLTKSTLFINDENLQSMSKQSEASTD